MTIFLRFIALSYWFALHALGEPIMAFPHYNLLAFPQALGHKDES